MTDDPFPDSLERADSEFSRLKPQPRMGHLLQTIIVSGSAAILY